MERNEALESYFFDEAYFQAIFEEMPAGARFALAEHDGRVIAATLYLHDSDDVYSYLGGADHEHQQLRPTNAVVHDTIRWAREQGKRRLILGGGYRPDDGIFRFKASFSPLRATLELARRVHLPDDSKRLDAAWRDHHGARRRPGRFFPPTGARVERPARLLPRRRARLLGRGRGPEGRGDGLIERYLDPDAADARRRDRGRPDPAGARRARVPRPDRVRLRAGAGRRRPGRGPERRDPFDVADATALPYDDGTLRPGALPAAGRSARSRTRAGREAALQEAARVLRPGGLALFSFVCLESRLASPAQRAYVTYLRGLPHAAPRPPADPVDAAPAAERPPRPGGAPRLRPLQLVVSSGGGRGVR